MLTASAVATLARWPATLFRRRRRNNVAGQRANVATAEAVNIQRRNIDQLHQRLAAAFDALESQLLLQLFVVLRRFGNRAKFGLAKWLGIGIPPVDRYASVVVFH